MGFLPISNMQNFKIKINKPKIKINKPKINLPKLNIVKPNLPKIKINLPKVDLQLNAVKRLEKLIEQNGNLVLIPYKSLMVKILKKKGHPVSMTTNLDKTANLFYSVVILGRQNFKNYQNLDASQVQGLSEQHAQIFGSVASQVSGGMIPKDKMTEKQKKNNEIALKILRWIKNLLDKKKKGEQLTEDEKEIENVPVPEAPTTPEKKKKKGNWFTRLIEAIFGGKNNEDFENFRRRISARNRELNVLSSPSIVSPPRTIGATLNNYTCNATELQADLMSKGLNFNGMYVNPVQSANDYLNLTRNLGTKKVIVTTPKNFNY